MRESVGTCVFLCETEREEREGVIEKEGEREADKEREGGGERESERERSICSDSRSGLEPVTF